MSQQQSYEWYKKEIQRALATLDIFQRCFFAAWCAEFLVRRNKSSFLSDYSENELREIEDYMREVWESAVHQTAIPVSRANEIKARLLAIGPQDPVAKIETDPSATEALCCLWNALEAQVDPSVETVAKASENLINQIDYLVGCDKPEYPYSLEDMFEFPPIAEEFRIQLDLIDNLKDRWPNSLVPRSIGLGRDSMLDECT
jgi:hypothetical protein